MTAQRSQKDKEMASYMKKHKIQRTTQQCPICNKLVANKAFYNHIATHK